MSRPVKHGKKYRIRYFDENGKRRSSVYPTYKDAERALRLKQTHVDQIKQGLRKAAPPIKTANDVMDYWLIHRAPRKRSTKDDESMIRVHRHDEQAPAIRS